MMLTVRMKLSDIANKQAANLAASSLTCSTSTCLSLREWSIVYDYADKHIWKRHKAAWKYWHRRAL